MCQYCEKEKRIELHYNVFETLQEQIEKQKYKCKDIEIYDKAKDSILYLYIHSIITENEKDKLIKKLHKEIIKNIEE